MENDEIGSHREKIESKGAYAYDLHKAIRDVQDTFKTKNLEKINLCLNVLRDICAPEIREAVNGEWLGIEKKYHDRLQRIENADFVASSQSSGWSRNNEIYYIPVPLTGTSQYSNQQLEEATRDKFLFDIWKRILHEKFQACIDCLDRHGELRKWRDVEYGRI